MSTRSWILVLSTMCLTACGTEADRPEPVTEPANETISAVPAHNDALERARSVNQDVLDAAERQRQAIEDQEGGG